MHIKRLREKLEGVSDKWELKTVWGVGYKFEVRPVMRKSISVAFFSLVSTLMVLGIVLMGASEWVLFKNYFAKDRYETLDQVEGVTQRTAQYLVQQAGCCRKAKNWTP